MPQRKETRISLADRSLKKKKKFTEVKRKKGMEGDGDGEGKEQGRPTGRAAE